MKSFLLLIFLLLSPHFLFAQKQGQALIDSLLKELPKAKEENKKDGSNATADILYKIADTYLEQNNFQLFLDYYGKIISLSDKLDDKKMKSQAFLHIGRAYQWQKNYYRQAMNYFHQAIKLKEETGDKAGIGIVLNSISSLYTSQGDYPNALNYGLQSLRIAEEVNHKKLMASDLNDIAIIYDAQHNYPKTLEYLLRALKMLKESGDNDMISAVTGNVGLTYSDIGDYPIALEYLQNSLALAVKYGFKDDIAAAYEGLGNVYRNQHNYAMALDFGFKALKINRERSDRGNAAKYRTNIGIDYLKIVKDTTHPALPDSLAHLSRAALLGKSISSLKASIDLCKEISSFDNLQQSYQLLSEAQSLSGDSKSALESYKQFVIYRDSVFSIEKAKEITRNEMQYDNDKEMAIAREADKARLKQYGITAAALLVIIFLSFYFYRKREKDRFQIQLTAVQQEALNAQMSDHFIGNAMDSINSFIENNDKDKASKYLIMFERLIRKVLDNSFKKLIPLTEELGILEMYIELEKLRFADGALQYEIKVGHGIDAENTLIPPMIFQVLTENALKHGLEKTVGGTLKLKVEKKENVVSCIVEDNGIGRAASMKGRQSINRTSYGNSLAEHLIKASGIAAKNASFKILDLLDGNDNPAGTRVEFSLPYIFNS